MVGARHKTGRQRRYVERAIKISSHTDIAKEWGFHSRMAVRGARRV